MRRLRSAISVLVASVVVVAFVLATTTVAAKVALFALGAVRAEWRRH